MTNGFLVSVPHEGLHGAISILEQRPELPTNMCKAWAVKDVVPLIAYCMCIAQCAPAQLPGDHWPDKPALLNRQGMGAHSEIASTTAFWKEAWECQNTAQNPTGLGEGNHAKYVHSLAPLDGASLGDTCRPPQTLRCCPSMFA